MKIFLRDGRTVDELEEEVTKIHDGAKVTYDSVYYLDYTVSEHTGMINKGEKTKYYTKGQTVRNLNSLNKVLGIK